MTQPPLGGDFCPPAPRLWRPWFASPWVALLPRHSKMERVALGLTPAQRVDAGLVSALPCGPSADVDPVAIANLTALR